MHHETTHMMRETRAVEYMVFPGTSCKLSPYRLETRLHIGVWNSMITSACTVVDRPIVGKYKILHGFTSL